MRCDGVFFDLYGTLLIYGDMTAAWSAWLRALGSWLRELGLTPEPDDLARRCRGFFSRPEVKASETTADLGPGVRPTPYERRLLSLCVELDGNRRHPTHRQLTVGADTTVAAWQRYVSLDSEALPVLSDLGAGRPLALISNFDHPSHVVRVLDATGLRSHFDSVTISGEIGVKKPDPRIFAPALDALELEPARVVYVGDAPEDVLAASAAGLTPVRVQRDGDTESDKAADFRHAGPRNWSETSEHLRVSHLRELPQLLASL